MTITVSQYGLTDLLRITIPALLLIYPVAIVLVLLQFLRKKTSINKIYIQQHINRNCLFLVYVTA